jgi:hypothetical protein
MLTQALGPSRDDRRVLVAYCPEPLDRELAARRGIYRARPGVSIDRLGDLNRFRTLAFYQGDKFGSREGRRIQYCAEVRRVRRATRREILPEAPDHPRANELYHVFDLGPLQSLRQPILSERARRLLFVPTTAWKLERAAHVNDLFLGSPLEESLYAELRGLELKPEREYFEQLNPPPGVQGASRSYFLDFAIFCRDRNLDVETDGDEWHVGRERARKDNLRDNDLERAGWHVLRYGTQAIQREMPQVVAEIQAAINRYGGYREPEGVVRRFHKGRLGPAQQRLELFGSDASGEPEPPE